MKYLVTGAAGFIGMYTCQRLLDMGHQVIGIDNLNAYYPIELKLARLKQLENQPQFRFIKLNLADRDGVANLFAVEKFQRVIHLGAQAGVRYSIEAPYEYIDSNLVGMTSILEGCRHNPVEHLVYASSSSGFFTVYGPWGRPDMAPWLFTDAILNDREIKVFNHGKMQRDFTYIDDIIEGVIRIQDVIPGEDNFVGDEGSAIYRVFNIGNNQPVELEQFITCIENALGKKANKNYLPMQDGDVVRTYADVSGLEEAVGFKPTTDLQLGINQFVDWYLNYHS